VAIKKSQKELVNKFSPVLFSVCRRYTKDDELAKDVLQESWIRIFKNLDKYEPFGSFEGWIKRITINAALRFVNKSYFKNEPNYEIFEDKSRSAQPKAYENLNAEIILKQIQKLPKGYQTIFNLNVIDGYSHKEIGKMLNISENTSRSQLLRARKALQNLLSKSEIMVNYER